MRVARHVHQQIAQRAVYQPGRCGCAAVALFFQLLQGDFDLVDLVVAGFVKTRGLAGRADEQTAEQIAQAGVVVPVADEAGQQLGLAQERAVSGRGAAQHKVVAAPGAGVATIEHEFFARQASAVRGFVQKLGVVDQLGPVVRGVDVDLDHTRVGRDLQELQARVARRRVALQNDLQLQRGGCGFDVGEQSQVVLQTRQWRHEDVDDAAGRDFFGSLQSAGPVGTGGVTHFNAQRCARDAFGGFFTLWRGHGAAGGRALHALPRDLCSLCQWFARRKRVALDDGLFFGLFRPRQ